MLNKKEMGVATMLFVGALMAGRQEYLGAPKPKPKRRMCPVCKIMFTPRREADCCCCKKHFILLRDKQKADRKMVAPFLKTAK